MRFFERWRSQQYSIDPWRWVRAAGWVALAGGVGWVLAGLLFSFALVSGMGAGPTVRVPETQLDATRQMLAQARVALPESTRILEAFQEKEMDPVFHLKLRLPERDLEVFTDQKLLGGKWQAGKGEWTLPPIVAENWRELAAAGGAGWQHWHQPVPYVKHEGQMLELTIIVSPPQAGAVTLFVKLVET